MDLVEKIFNEKFKPSTAKTYINRIKKLLQELNYKGKSLRFVNNIDKIENVLQNKSISVKKGTFVALSHLSKGKIKVYWTSKYKTINSDIFKNQKERILTIKDKENIITYPELKKLIYDKKKDYTKYILLKLLQQPFNIRNEYRRLKFGEDNNKDNFIDLNKGVIILNDYKTKDKYGKQEIELNKGLLTNLKTYHKKTKYEYLLGNEKMTSDKFSLLLTELFTELINKHITTNLLRKIIINDIVKKSKYQKLTETEKERFSEKYFGHSIEIMRLYYNKEK